MAIRRQDIRGPYTAQLDTAIDRNLDRALDLLDEAVLGPQRQQAANAMAKEMAMLNILSQEFTTARQEEHTLRREMIKSGIKLPSEDQTAGFGDVLDFMSDVSNMNAQDMGEQVQNQQQKIYDLYEMQSQFESGVKARKTKAISEAFATKDADLEDFRLTGVISPIEGTSQLGEGITATGELATDVEYSDLELEQLANDDYYRQGFNAGALNTSDAMIAYQTKLELEQLEQQVEAGDFSARQQRINLVEQRIGDYSKNMINVGLGPHAINAESLIQQMSGLAEEERSLEWNKYIKDLQAKAAASLEDGGAPTLTGEVMGIINDLVSGGPDKYASLVSQLAQSYAARINLETIIGSYANRLGTSYENADAELALYASGAEPFDIGLENTIEQYRLYKDQLLERRNLGLYSDEPGMLDIMSQAYRVDNLQFQLDNEILGNDLKNPDVKNDAIETYINDVSTDKDIAMEQEYRNMMEASQNEDPAELDEYDMIVNTIIQDRGLVLNRHNISQDEWDDIHMEAEYLLSGESYGY